MWTLLVVITLGPFSRILVGYAFAYYTMCSTTVSEFVTAMKKMHVPDQISIPLSVMFRFFPTLADIHPMALSGGQKQRAAIASAVVADNPVLLFDEPTSGLDLKHMRQVAALLRQLRDRGRTVIVITHDTELVQETADHIVSFS